MLRARYQQGCLYREKRRTGPDVWVFRWRESNADGVRRLRKITVGTVKEYPNQSAAQLSLAARRQTINQQARGKEEMTVGKLSEHFTMNELVSGSARRTQATNECYTLNLKNWILPRWGSVLLSEVKAVEVEAWLQDLDLAAPTKSKLRNQLSCIFNHALRYEFADRNPIKSVRQGSKRAHRPVVLELHELKALLAVLALRERVLVLLDVATGLRVSELLGLKWSDVDFERRQMNVTRSIVQQVEGPCKTEASQAPMPLDAMLVAELRAWKKQTLFDHPDDWVFASASMCGKQPYWPENLLRNFVRPAAKSVGITKHIGWHTFRRTFATLLKSNGEDVKVMQELMRHADPRTAMTLYAQAVGTDKRRAQTRIVKMVAGTAKTQGKAAMAS
ncbi:MAG: Site-specific recombinase XerD [Acidobacteriales bacterium]|nr:Site-specific recombinase XerD [Terriglobales bacterium]